MSTEYLAVLIKQASTLSKVKTIGEDQLREVVAVNVIRCNEFSKLTVIGLTLSRSFFYTSFKLIKWLLLFFNLCLTLIILLFIVHFLGIDKNSFYEELLRRLFAILV